MCDLHVQTEANATLINGVKFPSSSINFIHETQTDPPQ